MATQQLTSTATLLDASTVDVTEETVYTTSNPGVATVDADGLVTSVAPGSAVVTGNYLGLKDTVAVTVSPPGVLAVTPETDTLAVAETQQLAASWTPTGGSPTDVTGTATYSSSNPSVASVASTGVVTGVAAGSAVITVTYTGVTDTVPVTVTA